MNLVQFLPYYPPHKGWLETVAKELSHEWVKSGYGKAINISMDVDQDYHNPLLNYIFDDKGNKIWYIEDKVIVYLIPAIDIVSNFPLPKIWTYQCRFVLKQAKLFQADVLQTHTRFFLSSWMGWIFARKNKIKWVHIEHGSDYVKLGSKFKTFVARLYDKSLGSWTLRKADKVVGISKRVQDFVAKEFGVKNSVLIYNWINIQPVEKQDNWPIIKIWYVWRLVNLKWVDYLIKVFTILVSKHDNIWLEIVWDGDEKNKLLQLANNHPKIRFLWFQERNFIIQSFLPQIDILVNPSWQEWLPTSVIEGLICECVMVATDVGWTVEISDKDDLIIVEKWNLESIEKWIEFAIKNYKDLKWLSKQSVIHDFDWKVNIEKYYNLYWKNDKINWND